jgi:hypothetical protein
MLRKGPVESHRTEFFNHDVVLTCGPDKQ